VAETSRLADRISQRRLPLEHAALCCGRAGAAPGTGAGCWPAQGSGPVARAVVKCFLGGAGLVQAWSLPTPRGGIADRCNMHSHNPDTAVSSHAASRAPRRNLRAWPPCVYVAHSSVVVVVGLGSPENASSLANFCDGLVAGPTDTAIVGVVSPCTRTLQVHTSTHSRKATRSASRCSFSVRLPRGRTISENLNSILFYSLISGGDSLHPTEDDATARYRRHSLLTRLRCKVLGAWY
jgi:hypothetical protein